MSVEMFAPFVFSHASLLLSNNHSHNHDPRLHGSSASSSGSGRASALDLMCSMAVLTTAEREALVASLPLTRPPTHARDARSGRSSSSSSGEAPPMTWLLPLRSLLDDSHHSPAILYRILVSDAVQRYVNKAKQP